MLLYGLLNMPWVQNYIKDFVVVELKNKLQTDLGIESLSIQPFNTIQLNGVYLNDLEDSTVLRANKIYAEFDLIPLLNKQLVISSAKLSDFDVYLSKDSASAPLNIQFIIDAFKPKENSNSTKLDVKINSVNIADGRFRFDVHNKPILSNKFDPNHIDVSDLNAKLALKSLHPDSLNVQIKKLGLKEKSGLVIENLIVRVLTNENHLSIKGFKLSLPKSLLQFDKCEIDYSRFLTPADLLNNATFETQITSSYIALRDIAAFVPAFQHFEDRILFKTNISGKLDSIHVSNIQLDYGDKIHLTAQGFLSDIRNKEKTFIRASLDDLSVNEDGIVGLLNNFSKEKKTPPAILNNLGKLTFHGNISGYLKELKADGDLHSALGSIYANATIGIEPDAYNKFTFTGRVNTKNFELGNLLKNNDLGNISFDLNTNIVQPKQGKLNGYVDGIIENFTFKKYTYNNIDLGANYDGLKLDGHLALDDPNGILNINGLFDLSNKNEPILDFKARIKNVRLDNLNLSQKYKEAYMGVAIDANFKGKNIDDIQGYIKADSISFLQSGNSLKLDNLIIEASGVDDNRELSIKSDLINGKVTGAYSFTTIAESFKRTLNNYLPALISLNDKKQKNIKENNLNFDFTISNTENISEVLKLPVTLYSPTKIIGFYDNNTERFKLEAFLPSLKAGGSKIQSGYLNLENTDEQIKSTISGAFVTRNGTVNDLTVNLTAQNNGINIHTLLLNKDHTRLKGELSNTILFSKSKDKILQTNVHINAGELVLNSIPWNIKESDIQVKGSQIDVNNFLVTSFDDKQQLSIDGAYSSTNNNDILNVKLKSIDLSYIFNTLNIEALQFGGFASGALDVSSINGNPYADINLNVKDFAFNNTTLGDLELQSNLDAESKKVNLKGKIINENEKLTDINGFINPVTQELSINFDADDIDVAFLNKYVASLFNGVKGRGSGHVHLLGNFSKVTVEGEAFIQNGSVGINFLNTAYSFTDTIFMKKDLIYFTDVAFHDEKGNEARISGRVVHDYFSNFMYYVDLKGSNFLLYNATEKLNPLFYGTVFGSGSGVIKGDEKSIDINMNIRTDRNTNVFMNFMEDTATEYSFITYKTKKENTDSIGDNKPKLSKLNEDSGMEMNMNFYIDATPDATIELLMDPVGGDKLRGSGSGALQFVWGSNKDPMLYGTYQINKGSYNFTFQKILERKFAIQDGSSVQFRGDPFQANLDITAVYRITANLNDLDRNIAQSSGQTSVPVNCLLNLTGPLIRPNINLDIQLPSADPEIQRQVKSLINTEDMVNRQIVYLLLLSKFYTPNYAVTDQRTSDLAALASATLSAQLSNILSGIDDRWQVGTNIRTSDSEFSNTEVELVLSSRLLNDRVLLNGNFGYKDNMYTSDAFIGDIDIEVLLNRMGTWRLKAYNHYNEKFYYVRNAVQTQGLGIMYKRDFDTLRELFNLPKKTQKPIKQDTVAKQDSIASFDQFVKMKK